MFWTKLTLGFLGILIFLGLAVAAEQVEKGPVPDWVQRLEPAAPKDGNRSNGSVRYLLSDYQRHLEQQSLYCAFATTILTAAGAEEYSQISIDFQPTYQRLVWHRMVVERDGQLHDRLPVVQFEVIRRETGLDRQLYDGQLTAHAILKDIRPGDTIRYSYSIIGSNPIFKDHVHLMSQLAYGVGVDRVHCSVIWDSTKRDLRWRVEGGELEVVERDFGGGLRKLVYDQVDLKKWETENNTPGWYPDLPWLEISDYGTWQGFGDWAWSIYGRPSGLPPELKKVCDEIAAKGGSADQQIVEVLRWVQKNIRYLGSFFGEHTHEPYPLDQIIDRRYGDCKDKGVITVAMLRHLGYDAAPALVNTYEVRAIADNLPGHGGFDHLIVHLRHEGQDYWFDPTHAFQEGNLKDMYAHDYGVAFVVRDGTKALTPVEPRGSEVKRTALTERFDISAMKGASDLRVTTVATGRDADGLRRAFASASIEEMEKSYRDFYAADYPQIEVVTPLVMEDDVVGNRITLREHYRITGLWVEGLDEGVKKSQVNLHARSMGDYIVVPNEVERKKPYRIGHPVNMRHVMEVVMPEAWHTEPEEVVESLPSVDFRYQTKGDGKVCTITYDWTSKSDQVKPEDFKRYREVVVKAERLLHQTFSPPKPSFTRRHVIYSRLILVGMIAAGFFVAIIISWLVWRWDPPAREALPTAPVGIGGWMILPILGCFISPFIAIREIFIYFSSIGNDGFSLFGDYPEQFEWMLCYTVSVFVQSLLLFLMVFQIFLLFKRRTSFPWFFIGFSVLFLLAHFVIVYMQGLPSVMKDVGEEEAYTNGARLIFRLLIWGSYMKLSQRVCATFVIRRFPPVLPPPPTPVPSGMLE